jgi:hypothetical protein
MSRWLARSGLLLLGVGVLVGAFLIPIHPLAPTSANAIAPAVFDIDATYVPGQGWDIPPNGSTWHELYPAMCASHPQADYDDSDGSGTVTPCDNIIEVPYELCWHIVEVKTTYFLSCQYHPEDVPTIAESPEPPGPADPVCQVWHVIDPVYCEEMHISDWVDCNGNNMLDECDIVYDGTQCWHVDRVALDVTVAPNPATPTKKSSWGWLKSLFGK